MRQPLARFLLFAGILVLGVGFAIYEYGTEEVVTPCSPGGNPARCYQITQKMCDAVWATTEEPCKAFLKKFDLPPGRLIGPIIFRCQWAYLDNAFAGARKPSPDCNSQIEELKEWEARNDFKP